MKILKQISKKYLLSSLAVLMVFFISGMMAHATENPPKITSELVDLSTVYSDFGISALGVEDGNVDLAEGNYEKWIDRIEVPDYALNLYDTLVEYNDNDGIDDFMITDSGYSASNATVVQYGAPYGSDTFHAIEFCTIKNPTESDTSYVFKAMRAVFDAYDMDHPEVFWLSGTSYGYILRYYEPDLVHYTDTYYFMIKMHEGSYTNAFDVRAENYQSEQAIREHITLRDNAVKSILNTDAVKNASNDYEKVKALNNWLIYNNEYNLDVYANNTQGRTDAHKCIGALTGGTGNMRPVCEGYAKAFKVLCDALNIPCVVTTGNAYATPDSNPEAHSWNFVSVDGVWYATDVTWNDPAISNGSGPVTGYENESYLLVGSDTVISGMQFDETHVAVNSVSTNGISFTNGPIISPKYCVPEEPKEDQPSTTEGVTRIAGTTRYETSLAIADAFKEKSGMDKFTTVIIASGKNFADALAGSYLACETEAPILMTNGKNLDALDAYISKNLITGGTIYLLGGSAAVPESVEEALAGLGTITRLSGPSRYDTNLEILKKAGVKNQDIFVCTGKNFADSLSASAAKKPILLVNNKTLSSAQKEFLKEYAAGKLYIIGGEGAVNKEIEAELSHYGETKRISGSTRYETSILFAETFFDEPVQAVLAYAKNFPDGLCGGALAMSMDAPLILTATSKEEPAIEYMSNHKISSGIVLGGSSLISDDSAKLIFALETDILK